MEMQETTTCDLLCENGGYCTVATGDAKELSKRAVGGDLLERCVCRPGYGGIACEQTVEECSSSSDGGGLTCHNGVPCKAVVFPAKDDGVEAAEDEERFQCDCEAAVALSRFAYEMCRRPATEYCGHDSPMLVNSFCTNGGSCASNLGVRIENKDLFEHEGCVCPPEFHGPHCEYLVGYGPSPDSYGGPIRSSSTSIVLGQRGAVSKFVIIMLIFGSGAAVTISAVVSFQRRRRRRDLEARRAVLRRELSLQENIDDVEEELGEAVVAPFKDGVDGSGSMPYKDAPDEVGRAVSAPYSDAAKVADGAFFASYRDSPVKSDEPVTKPNTHLPPPEVTIFCEEESSSVGGDGVEEMDEIDVEDEEGSANEIPAT